MLVKSQKNVIFRNLTLHFGHLIPHPHRVRKQPLFLFQLLLFLVLLGPDASLIDSLQLHVLPGSDLGVLLGDLLDKTTVDRLGTILETVDEGHGLHVVLVPVSQQLLKVPVSAPGRQVCVVDHLADYRLLVQVFLHAPIQFLQPAAVEPGERRAATPVREGNLGLLIAGGGSGPAGLCVEPEGGQLAGLVDGLGAHMRGTWGVAGVAGTQPQVVGGK